MIRKVHIQNFKSTPDLVLELGRVTVLVGANGSGKSNILEAVAFASAAAQNKLDNEFLNSRGIRVTETRFMRSAFDMPAGTASDGHRSPQRTNMIAVKRGLATDEIIDLSVRGDDEVEFDCMLSVEDETASYPKWQFGFRINSKLSQFAEREFAKIQERDPAQLFGKLLGMLRQVTGALPGFLIFSPENSALRTFQAEGQILPLSIRGEGLFAHLKALGSKKYKGCLAKIKERLTLIDWFETFDIPAELSPGERSIRIRDRFLPEGMHFDQRSANEGFLFLLFYITLFISPDTPAFFAIDNIDTALNPKLCAALLRQLVILAKEHDKQVILTTHNPAVLDGLDLHDDEQRLLVVDRNKNGHTRVRPVDPPQVPAGQPPVSLSEAFLRGFIGGLPKNF